jgi:hypothetical protein
VLETLFFTFLFIWYAVCLFVYILINVMIYFPRLSLQRNKYGSLYLNAGPFAIINIVAIRPATPPQIASIPYCDFLHFREAKFLDQAIYKISVAIEAVAEVTLCAMVPYRADKCRGEVRVVWASCGIPSLCAGMPAVLAPAGSLRQAVCRGRQLRGWARGGRPLLMRRRPR